MRTLKPILSAVHAAAMILGIAALILSVGLLRAGDPVEIHADGGRPNTTPVSSTQPGDSVAAAARHESAAQGSGPTEEIRKELLEARSTAWRAFFQKDLTVLEQILAPELIAIQEQVERWDNRASLLKMAQSMKERGVQLTRLEFPRTEIQLFGNTAILYYTYVMEQRLGDQAAVDTGRGTEIFVRRDGKWVDVGWHLDQGAFQRKNGAWVRLGQSVPEAGSAPSRTPQ
jgi:uncharacterized protein DUF4440